MSLRRLSAAARRVRAKQYERERDEREQERRRDRRDERRTEKARRSQRPRRSRRARLGFSRQFERSRLVAQIAEQSFESLDLLFALARDRKSTRLNSSH